MIYQESYIQDIISRLRELDPIKIVLFGSRATGNYHEDSDFDILIVLNINSIPNTYDEKIDLKLEVRKKLRDIGKKIPIDLIVYTIPEYNSFMKATSSFANDLVKTGRIIYEKAS